MLDFPWGVATSATGNVFIGDRVNNRVRMVAAGIVAGMPTLADNPTVNGASFAQISIAPGAIVAIFGTGLAGSTMSALSVPLPKVLGDTSVTFNGIAAPLYFVSSGQINAQAPFELPAGIAATVQVQRGSNVSTVRTANVAVVSPGIFLFDQASNAGAVLHGSDFSPVSSSSPMRPGEYLVIYCTGLGPVLTPMKSGDPAPGVSPLAGAVYLPALKIAGLPASVSWAGLAPGFVGLFQINAQAPAALPAGNQPVQITTLGVASNTVTISATR